MLLPVSSFIPIWQVAGGPSVNSCIVEVRYRNENIRPHFVRYQNLESSRKSLHHLGLL